MPSLSANYISPAQVYCAINMLSGLMLDLVSGRRPIIHARWPTSTRVHEACMSCCRSQQPRWLPGALDKLRSIKDADEFRATLNLTVPTDH